MLRIAFAGRRASCQTLQTLRYSTKTFSTQVQQPTQLHLSNVGVLNSKRMCVHHILKVSNLNLDVNQNWMSSISKADVESRVLTVCKAFDKITADKLTLESHFINDLGLDSLDHVEVIMAIEDEFGFEIPDDHAEKLLTPNKIVEYVSERENVTA